MATILSRCTFESGSLLAIMRVNSVQRMRTRTSIVGRLLIAVWAEVSSWLNGALAVVVTVVVKPLALVTVLVVVVVTVKLAIDDLP